MRSIILFLSFFFVVVGLSFADVQAQSRLAEGDGQDEANVRRIARERLYAGGEDEELLKVQEQLPVIKKDGDNEADLSHSSDAD